MHLDELFRNLGCLAATLGAQVKDGTLEGVPLEELDLTGPAPGQRHMPGSVTGQVELFERNAFERPVLDLRSQRRG